MQLKRPVIPSQIKALREKILAKDVLEEYPGEGEGENGGEVESGKEEIGEQDCVV